MFNPSDWQIVADPEGKAIAAAKKHHAIEQVEPLIGAVIAILHGFDQLTTAHTEPLTIVLEVSCGQRVTVVIGTDKPCPEGGK